MRKSRTSFGYNWCERRLEETALKEKFKLLRGGWPDYVLIKGGKVTFIEVKPNGAHISEVQSRMFSLIKALGWQVMIAVNGDLEDLIPFEEYEKQMGEMLTSVRKFLREENAAKIREKQRAENGRPVLRDIMEDFKNGKVQ